MFSIQSFLTWQSKLLMTYKHLSQAERYQIHALMKAGHDQSQIANLLDRHKSTISRELSRNTGSRGYRPKQACEMSADRAQNSRNANTVPAWVNDQAQLLLQLQWSPEQIASKLPISHETVYQHVYADKAQGGVKFLEGLMSVQPTLRHHLCSSRRVTHSEPAKQCGQGRGGGGVEVS